VTLELSNVKRLYSEQLDVYWSYNQWSLFNYMSQATYGIHGTVTNSRTGEPLAAEVRVQNHDDNSSWVVSDSLHGRFYRYLIEGTYDLAVSAPGHQTRVIEDVMVYNFQKTELQVALDSVDTGLDPSLSPERILYPNPAQNRIQITSSNSTEEMALLRIVASDGRAVTPASVTTQTGRVEVDISNLAEGIYFLGVKAGEELEWIKMVKSD
jgi:hypothetical protein